MVAVTLSFGSARRTVVVGGDPAATTVGGLLQMGRKKLKARNCRALFDRAGQQLDDARLQALLSDAGGSGDPVLCVLGTQPAAAAPQAGAGGPEPAEEVSAGMVLTHGSPPRPPRALLIRRGTKSSYELPKGHVEAGETSEQAAAREAAEEAGLQSPVSPRALLATVSYSFAHRKRGAVNKTVHYHWFTAAGDSGELQFGEREALTRELRWVGAAELRGDAGRPLLAGEDVTAAVEKALQLAGAEAGPGPDPEAEETCVGLVLCGVRAEDGVPVALVASRSRTALELPTATLPTLPTGQGGLPGFTEAEAALRARTGITGGISVEGELALCDEVTDFRHHRRGLVRRRYVLFRASLDAPVSAEEAAQEGLQWLSLDDVRAGGLRLTVKSAATHLLRALKSATPEEDGELLCLELVSFGHKHGAPGDAGRCWKLVKLPNPARTTRGRTATGLDKRLASDFFAQPGVEASFQSLLRETQAEVEEALAEGQELLKLAYGCHSGLHRSVAVVERLARDLELPDGVMVTVTHRDIALVKRRR